MRWLVLIGSFSTLFLFISCSNKGKKEVAVTEEVAVKTDSLKLIFVGDVMVHDAQIDGALLDGDDTKYNFHPVFQYITDYISSADLALANLEVTFGGKPYRGYPAFSAPPQLADALKTCGFDILFLANNHILDRGKKGLEGTIQLIKETGLHPTGAFIDAESRKKHYPLILKKNNFTIAFLNYTYDTNGLVQSKPNIINYLDTALIKKDLDRAVSMKPDYIIAYIHWGEEYEIKESILQRRMAEILAENGTDCIIGSHPHVVQPFSYIVTQAGKKVPVMYSLGNFISNQRERHTDGGIALELLLTKSEEKTSLSSTHYEPLWVNRIEKEKRFTYRVIPVNDYKRNKTKYQLTKQQQADIKQFEADVKKIVFPPS